MPVLRTATQPMDSTNRPEWSAVTAAGRFSIPRDGGRFDRHYHDCDEYWLIYRGRATIMTEGTEYEVGPGDIVCTQAGQEHDVMAVEEDLEGFFFEDALRPGGRSGHLHRSPDLAEGHKVRAGR